MSTPISLKQALFKAAPPTPNNGMLLPAPPPSLLKQFDAAGVVDDTLDPTKTPWTFDLKDPISRIKVDVSKAPVQLHANDTAGNPFTVFDIMQNTYARPSKDGKATEYFMAPKGAKPIMFIVPKGQIMFLGCLKGTDFHPSKILLDGKVTDY